MQRRRSLIVLATALAALTPFAGAFGQQKCGDLLPLASLSTPGEARGVAAVGDRLFVADWQSSLAPSSLRIYDVADPANPIFLGATGLSGSAADVAPIDDRYLIVTVANAGVDIVDASDPAAPAVVASVDPPQGQGRAVEVFGSYAYVADGTAGLRVYDVSDPLAPTVLATLAPAGTEIIDVAVTEDGQTVVAAAFVGGFAVFDVSDPAAPTLASQVVGPFIGEHVAVEGAVAYLTADRPQLDYQLRLYDVSDPAAPGLLSFELFADAELRGVAARDGFAYVAASRAGDPLMLAFDAREPAMVELVGEYEASNRPSLVSLVDDVAALSTEFFGGVELIDVSNCPPCPGDATGDDLVNADDLLAVLGSFGLTVPGGAADGDLDRSGAVNADDLLIVLGAFGSAC